VSAINWNLAFVKKVADVIVINTWISPKDLSKFNNIIIADGKRIVMAKNLPNQLAIMDMFGADIWQSVLIDNFSFFPLAYFEWFCHDSPWKICVYDHENDKGHDRCLICGQPEERK
jgi:hypothetical protein